MRHESNAPMRDTQMNAWDSIQAELPASRLRVIEVIAQAGPFGITTIGISNALRLPINCISGRVTELADKGHVKDSGRRGINPSGKPAILWVLRDQPIDIHFEENGQGTFI